MNYDKRLLMLVLLAGSVSMESFISGMEHVIVQDTALKVENDDNKSILKGLCGLPQNLIDTIIGLSLASSLSYNFTSSKVQAGHTRLICSLACSSDGSTVLTGSMDYTAHLWNIKTGKEIHLLQGHTDKVASVAFCPNGATALTGSFDETARLWNVRTGQQLHLLQGQGALILSVAWSSDGKTVITGSHEGTVCVWSVETGKLLSKLEIHSGCIYAVAYSPDGSTILTGSNDLDNPARLSNVKTGHLLKVL
ncbi:WD40 repeat domain-containing protein, partial [Candidatus Dependentiae bacterium]|nr:WD40 repeat domain-containing protein [Candidatus Dependentiae bacterium]